MPKSNHVTDTKTETFSELCKELGRRISSTENALLCYRAYQAYLREKPDTAHGKGNKLDRDTSSPAFYKAAAKASGVAPATISALLQVGKAIAPLPERVKTALAGSSLGNSMRMLRKLAKKDHEKDRAELITKFAREEKADSKSARKSLMQTLGMAPKERESHEGEEVDRKSAELAEGEHLELTFGHYLVRVVVGGQAGGRIHLTATAIAGKRKKLGKFLESGPAGPTRKKKPNSKPVKPGGKAAKLAA
jgi:hypothetical protein